MGLQDLLSALIHLLDEHALSFQCIFQGLPYFGFALSQLLGKLLTQFHRQGRGVIFKMNDGAQNGLSVQVKGHTHHILVGRYEGTIETPLRLLRCGHIDNAWEEKVSCLSHKLLHVTMGDLDRITGL